MPLEHDIIRKDISTWKLISQKLIKALLQWISHDNIILTAYEAYIKEQLKKPKNDELNSLPVLLLLMTFALCSTEKTSAMIDSNNWAIQALVATNH